MLFGKKENVSADQFWREYEETTGETVLVKSLGKYISGLDGFPEPLWGLVIATSGGFRFHHFPNEGWLMGLSRITTSSEKPKEKKFFIPRENFLSVELLQEKRWWKRFLGAPVPLLVISCLIDGAEKKVIAEIDRDAETLAQQLQITNSK